MKCEKCNKELAFGPPHKCGSPDVSESSFTGLLTLPSYQAAIRACGIYERARKNRSPLGKEELWEWAVNRSMTERNNISISLAVS